jgi:antitoxin component YwqK of YwqJK toxin-antitoxin module
VLIQSELEIIDDLTEISFRGIGNEDVNGNKVGLWKFEEISDGPNKMVGVFIDNKKSGEWKYLNDEINQPWLIVNYNEGVLEGNYRYYNSDGELIEEKNYKKGVLNGEYTLYENSKVKEFENGNIIVKILRKSLYDNGNLTGDIVYFLDKKNHPSIEIKLENTIDNYNRKHQYIRNLKVYYRNTQLLTQGNLVGEDEMDGEWTVYYPSGNVYLKGNMKTTRTYGSFVNSIESFLENLKFYNCDEVLYFEDVNDGEKYGKLYDLQDFLFTGENHENRRSDKEGTWVYYYDNGKIKDSLNFSRGVFSGIQKSFYENGVLKSSGKYKQYFDGVYPRSSKIGEWKSYNNSGELTQFSIYKEISNGMYSSGTHFELVYEERYTKNILRYVKESKNYNGKNLKKEFNELGLINRSYFYEEGSEGVEIEEKFTYGLNDEIKIKETKLTTRPPRYKRPGGYENYKETIKTEYFDEIGNLIKINRNGDWNGIEESDFQEYLKKMSFDKLNSSELLEIPKENKDLKTDSNELNIIEKDQSTFNTSSNNNSNKIFHELKDIRPKLRTSKKERYLKRGLNKIVKKHNLTLLEIQRGIKQLSDGRYYIDVYTFENKIDIEKFYELKKGLNSIGRQFIKDESELRLYIFKKYN